MHPFHFEQLKRDHEEVKQILSQMVESSNKSRKTELKKQLEKSLVPHMRAEEAVFYPALSRTANPETRLLKQSRSIMPPNCSLRNCLISGQKVKCGTLSVRSFRKLWNTTLKKRKSRCSNCLVKL